MLPSLQCVSSVGQSLCWLCLHRPHEDVMGLEWCVGMPPPVHFLNCISLLVLVSPPCASLPCHASFAAASEFGWAKACAGCACTGRMRTLWVWSGAWECPPPRSLPKLFLFSFMSPHHALPSLVMLALPQWVSSVGQGLCWLRVHRPHEDVMGLEWCVGMPPPVHFLICISLLVHVSPPCASLPCHASFLADSEFGWAWVVLAARAPAA